MSGGRIQVVRGLGVHRSRILGRHGRGFWVLGLGSSRTRKAVGSFIVRCHAQDLEILLNPTPKNSNLDVVGLRVGL